MKSVEKAPKKLPEKTSTEVKKRKEDPEPKKMDVVSKGKTKRRIVIDSDDDNNDDIVFEPTKAEEEKTTEKVNRKEITRKKEKEAKEAKETSATKGSRSKKTKKADYDLVIEKNDSKKESTTTIDKESAKKEKKVSSGGYRGKWQTTQRDPPKHGQKPIPKGKPDCLEGCVFVLTGLNESLTRDEMSALIQSHGG